MACQTIYADQMSLHLDGQLDTEAERALLAHIGSCAECTAIWGPMNEAHAMLVASAREPLAVPVAFTLKVMELVAATPVLRPQLDPASAPPVAVPVGASVMPVFGSEDQVHSPDYLHDWQHAIGVYVRGMAAVGAALAGTAAVLVTLVLTGVLRVDASVAPLVETVRTFLAAGAGWAASLVEGIGTDMALGGAIVLGLLALAGWQLVTNYHQATADYHLESAIPVMEAA
ncbi:MAG: anti-sigma factor family protein [Chloroflexia bacterium]